MRKIKKLFLFFGLVLAAISVSGCGEKTGEVWPEKWDVDATGYFNKFAPPLSHLPGKVYHYQVVRVDGSFYFNSLYIDGQFVEDLRPNGMQKIGGVSANQLDGVHVVYSKEEGYKVSTKYEDGRTIYKALVNNFPIFFRQYL
ncbi:MULTISPECIES: hypothetical protein [Pseudomonas chlororaphis group]|uniref:hypothetical protein n=1 Tax=Pseudomonas chlororaphis group TaxID=136842 RepID=UPI00209841AA|nr:MULTISPECIES: hypothetical protein [Pseudomonas chlororaphis group]MCO7577818.1 hypothetical protein [Pseudomonas protegens]MCO7584193.1 hypothetical protein [Pseudomonas chlororaphis]MCO7601201.1 hypothetical protein [Pseudomonas chlororaphis]